MNIKKKLSLDSDGDKGNNTTGDSIVSTNNNTNTALIANIGDIVKDRKINGVTVSDMKKPQLEANTFLTNSEILHSKLLYKFSKSGTKTSGGLSFSEDDTNTLFTMLETERKNLLTYIDYLPLGEVIVLNKFLNKNFDRSTTILRFDKLHRGLKKKIQERPLANRSQSIKKFVIKQ